MGERIIKLLNSAVNLAALFCFAICIIYGVYGIWDSARISKAADSSQYQKYQPDENQEDQFAELQKMNPEVIGWLGIEGTNINYPIVQGKDNRKYVDTDAIGKYAQSGSLFLDYRNKKDFSSMNNIIYGHHMEGGKMFGDLECFLDESFFEAHQTGRLYFDGKYHALKIIAVFRGSAYDKIIYDPNIDSEENFQELIWKIEECAVYMSASRPEYGEHLLLLSTCDTEHTAGRLILATRICEK